MTPIRIAGSQTEASAASAIMNWLSLTLCTNTQERSCIHQTCLVAGSIHIIHRHRVCYFLISWRKCISTEPCVYGSPGCATDDDCQEGLTCGLLGDVPTCLDLDECAQDPTICGPNSCLNLMTTYRLGCQSAQQFWLCCLAGLDAVNRLLKHCHWVSKRF